LAFWTCVGSDRNGHQKAPHAWRFVKEKDMPPNRMVALLTPVAALAAGGVATWIADNLGVQVQAEEVQAIMIAALIAVLAPAAQWLHGSQKYERHQSELELLALQADTKAAEQAAEVEMAAASGAYEDEDDGGDDGGYYDDDEHADDYEDDDHDDYQSALEEEQPAAR
jgi:hypothetical protein